MSENHRPLTLRGLVARAAVVHTVSYFAVGILAFTVFDYTARFSEPGLRDYMRPTNDPLVMAGVLFQPIRGALFGAVFYLLRDVLFRRRGWWVTWVTLVVIGIVSTFGPAPGSIEGVIYTKVPIGVLWGGLAEVLVQSLLLSTLLFHWVHHPERRWLGGLFVVLFVVALGLPGLGLISQPP
jgi:hypothetical protein